MTAQRLPSPSRLCNSTPTPLCNLSNQRWGRGRPGRQIDRAVRRRAAHRRPEARAALGVARGTRRAWTSHRDRCDHRLGPDLSPEALGFPVTAFLSLEIRQGTSQGGHDLVGAHPAAIPEVLEGAHDHRRRRHVGAGRRAPNAGLQRHRRRARAPGDRAVLHRDRPPRPRCPTGCGRSRVPSHLVDRGPPPGSCSSAVMTPSSRSAPAPRVARPPTTCGRAPGPARSGRGGRRRRAEAGGEVRRVQPVVAEEAIWVATSGSRPLCRASFCAPLTATRWSRRRRAGR